MSNTMQTHNPTACCNLDCEHRPSCYRAQLWDERQDDLFIVASNFSRDPRDAKLRGWDCWFRRYAGGAA